MRNAFTKTIRLFSRVFLDELKLLFTDAGAVLFFVAAIFVYSFLYTLGYEKETVRDIPIAVVDLDHTSASRQYNRMIDATEQLQVTYHPGSLEEARLLFFDDRIKGVILIPEDFEKNILLGIQTNVIVYCDASYFMLYKQIYAGAVYATGTFGAGIEIKRMMAEGKSYQQAIDLQEPVKTEIYNLYNPSGGYGSFIMPGMILIITQQLLLVGIGMLGGTILEKRLFLSMPRFVFRKWGIVQLVFAKASAYVAVFLVTSLFSMGILHRWFAFPDQGHLLTILPFLIVYLYTVSFLGLGISMLFKERVQSILFLVFMSPMIVFVSGISWPSSSLPTIIRDISYLFPSTIMVPAYIRLRLIGVGFQSVRIDGLLLFIQMVVYFVFASLAYKFAIGRFSKRISFEHKSDRINP